MEQETAKFCCQPGMEAFPFWMVSGLALQLRTKKKKLASMLVLSDFSEALVKQLPGHGRRVLQRAESDLRNGSIDSVYIS